MWTRKNHANEPLADRTRLLRRTLWIVFVTVSAMLLFVGIGISNRVQGRRYVTKLEKRGAWFVETKPKGPDWLPFLIGEDIVDLSVTVTEISGDQAKLSDKDLKEINRYFSPVELFLGGCPISNGGLAHLSALVDLEVLDLSGTKITDSGLSHLYPLVNLKELYLTDTKISNSALKSLQSQLPDCTIYEPSLHPRHVP